MDTDGGGGYAQDLGAETIGVFNDTGTGDIHIGYALVERGHGVPESRFGAADTAVTNGYRPYPHFVETGGGAVGKGLWALATDLIEAVARLVKFVAELLETPTSSKWARRSQ